MIDAIADYHDSIRDRRPLADVTPGYLQELLPRVAPEQPEQWDDVFKDIERAIMPGVRNETVSMKTYQRFAHGVI